MHSRRSDLLSWNSRKSLASWVAFAIVASAVISLAADAGPPGKKPKAPTGEWRGVHLMAPHASQFALLARTITNALAPLGVNALVLEIDYKFSWQSHPDLRAGGGFDKKQARELAALCRAHGIRLIPLFNCLGHQSWDKGTAPLLTKHPEFDETPQIPKDNPGIYCRSWCPMHPRVNKIVFALMDELLDAFQADALHVGMDEVFLLGSEQCPRCHDQNRAYLFARAVKDYHRHLVGKKKVQMLMWGDRLLDNAQMKYGKWESSDNGTAPAIDLIPKDIIICDWHYELRDAYPSVPYFQKKGFRVWPSSWKNEKAALAFLDYARQNATDKMLGHMCTTWSGSEQICRVLLGEDQSSLANAKEIVRAMRSCLEKMRGGKDGQSSADKF